MHHSKVTPFFALFSVTIFMGMTSKKFFLILFITIHYAPTNLPPESKKKIIDANMYFYLDLQINNEKYRACQ